MLLSRLTTRVVAIVMIVSFSLIFFSACSTHLSSKRISASSGSFRGIDYSLPMTQYKITIVRTIEDCPGDDNSHVKIKTKANIEETSISDPHQTYLIDYEDLSSGNKVTSITVEKHENGTLKSINASVDDQTDVIINNTVAAVADIALAALGKPPLPGAAYQPPAKCKKEVIDALKKLTETKNNLSEAKQGVKEAQTSLDEVKLRIASQSKAPKKARKELDLAIKKLNTETKLLDKLIKAREPYVQVVTHVSSTINWPNSGDEKEKVIDDGKMPAKKWIKNAGVDNLAEKIQITAEIKPLIVDPAHDGEATLEPTTGCTKIVGKEPVCSGIFYRLAVPARLELRCNFNCVENKSDVIATMEGRIPQLGTRLLLPFENETMQDNTIAITFDSKGNPTKLTYEQSGAPLTSLSGNVADAASKAKEVKYELELAELRSLQHEKAILAEQQGILDVEQKLNITRSMADLKVQNETLTTKVALLQQQKALLDAEKALAPPTEDALSKETADIQAQVVLLRARMDMLKAQKDLDELMKK